MTIALASEVLLVWLFSASLWMSLRVLRYPDLGIEQIAVLLGAAVIVADSGRIASPAVVAVLVLLLVVIASAITVLRVLLKLNSVLVALCLAYTAYSASLLVLDGPNRAIAAHVVPADSSTLLARAIACMVTSLVFVVVLRSRFGGQLLASASNRELYTRLTSLRQLVGIQLLGHVLALMPLAIFAIAMIARSGFVDVGITYGRLLQALFVVLVTVSVYPRCRFELAGALMLAPTAIAVLAGRFLLEVGFPSYAYSGAMAVAILAFLLALRSSVSVFRLEEVLKA